MADYLEGLHSRKGYIDEGILRGALSMEGVISMDRYLEGFPREMY